MAPREALQNVQYNILASAEAGLPVSKAPSTTLLLQPPLHGAPHKRSVKPRLTGNIITLWGLVCLLLLSLTVLTKNFSYVVLPNDQNATLFDATELSSDDTLKNKLHPLSDSLATDTTSIVVDARAKPKGTHSNNERVTLEEKTQNNQEKEDKLLRDAISQLVQRPWPKCLPPVEVLPKSPDSCADYTQTPKVAILFLTRGNLFHEPIWKEWFRSVAGLLPEESVAAALDDENKLKNVEEICRSEGIKNTNETDIIASQHLFNVYIHAPPSFNESELSPLWKNHLIQHRLNPSWGSADLVQATRFLLWEAFRDPANQRFILLSETDVPLVNPLVFYRQLIGEDRSRTNAWLTPGHPVDAWRWTWRMAMPPYNIRQSMWRKSSQWFSLIRSHAELVLRDNDVFRGFEEYCKSGWDGDYNRWRDCYTDEHYIPTLLAMKNLENETFEEVGSGTYADWSRGGPHPREFTKEDISVAFFGGKLGVDSGCLTPNLDRQILSREIDKTFINTKEMENYLENYLLLRNLAMKRKGKSRKTGGESVYSRSLLPAEYFSPPLKSTCYVSARKFGPETVDTLLDEIYLRCDNGLALLDKDVCKRAQAKRVEQKRWAALEKELVSKNA